jgi:hypothetical protein
VVTDLALLDFEPISRRMRLRGLQAGVTVSQVCEQTGFELLVSADIEELSPPSTEEVAIYRALRDGPAAFTAGGSEPTGLGATAVDGAKAPGAAVVDNASDRADRVAARPA